MNVYVLFYFNWGGGSHVMGTYSTREKAEAARAKSLAGRGEPDDRIESYDIEEYEVDKSPEDD